MLHFLLRLGEKCQNPSPERKIAESMDLAGGLCLCQAAQRILDSNSCRQRLSFLIAETKGTMETLNLKPMEQAKIACAKK
jgi:hypothetical protein